MADDPNVLIQDLKAFYAGDNPLMTTPSLLSWFGHSKDPANEVKYKSSEAMRRLVQQATYDLDVRKAFAKSGLFEQALMFGPGVPRGQDGGRLKMLEGIHEASIGSWFSDPDPGGITRWIGSEAFGGLAFRTMLETDPDPAVRIAGAKLVRDAAMPASWLTQMGEGQVFAKVDNQLREQRLGGTQVQRQALAALTPSASARVFKELVPNMPTFLTGEAKAAATDPPAPKPWWREGYIWSSGVLGALIGGFAKSASRR